MADHGPQRPSRASRRPVRRRLKKTIYFSIFIVSLLCARTLLGRVGVDHRSHNALGRRDLVDTQSGAPAEPSSDCHLVHHSADQCAYIREHCPDEEAGVFSYLNLYYCRLSQARGFALLLIILWLGFLFNTIGVAASDFFCVNLSTISNLLGMSESLAGVTFLAFGNGSADVFSTFAAMNSNSGGLAIGELIGAAGFITSVVAGSMAIVRPFKVAKKSFVRDVSFFIVAASFSMVFLKDGVLYWWECVSMVGLYAFYVVAILFWHWWFDRRRKGKLAEAAARAQFATPGHEEEEIFAAYHDNEDDGQDAASNMDRSADPIASSERGGNSGDWSPQLPGQDELDEQMRERMLGEISSNMRVGRPQSRSRSNTSSAIRPSLVGALEFRSVLGSLQKSRTQQSTPIGLQPYTDSPDLLSPFTPALTPGSAVSRARDHGLRQPLWRSMHSSYSHTGLLGEQSAAAVSETTLAPARDRERSRTTTDRPPEVDLLTPTVRDQSHRGRSSSAGGNALGISQSQLPSLTVSVETSRSSSPRADSDQAGNEILASSDGIDESLDLLSASAGHGTAGTSRAARTPPLPQLKIPDTQPMLSASPLSYHDEMTPLGRGSRTPSLRLPHPSLSPSILSGQEDPIDSIGGDKVGWWPYQYLPGPRELFETLFPTLVNWRSKSVLGKAMGLVAAPSVLLLTLTLPVVEHADEDDESIVSGRAKPAAVSRQASGASPGLSGQIKIARAPRAGETSILTPDYSDFQGENGTAHIEAESSVATAPEPSRRSTLNLDEVHDPLTLLRRHSSFNSHYSGLSRRSRSPSEHKTWNRWLVLVQAALAPPFIALIVWANTSAVGSPRELLKTTLISLLVSLVILAFLLATTTEEHPPSWRPLLCFAGFVVAIAWISSIANEVVGVLKSVGVIFDISDAILGLTVFAVGNSLGDLVADITVARLGYPVMALSACFGGPLLNILLGVGLSGCYIALWGSKVSHPHHHDAVSSLAPSRLQTSSFEPYHIDVGRSLVISGITLLITLASLLVVVPLRGWRMDKPIGWGLVTLWTVSTMANVLVEVLSRKGGIIAAQ